MQRIEKFFKLPLFAVVGASNNREKFGNKVLLCYVEFARKVVPISKTQSSIEGFDCFESLSALKVARQEISPGNIGVSVVTGPSVTKHVLKEGIELGYRNFFLQPGTTDASVDEFIRAQRNQCTDLNIIEGCVLKTLPGFSS